MLDASSVTSRLAASDDALISSDDSELIDGDLDYVASSSSLASSIEASMLIDLSTSLANLSIFL